MELYSVLQYKMAPNQLCDKIRLLQRKKCCPLIELATDACLKDELSSLSIKPAYYIQKTFLSKECVLAEFMTGLHEQKHKHTFKLLASAPTLKPFLISILLLLQR